MSWTQWFLAVLLIGVCGLLILVVLLQRGRGGGLAGAFGGGGGSSAFGAKTGDVLTWITVGVATVFLLLSVVANFAFDQSPRPAATAEVTLPAESGEPSESDSSTLPITLEIPAEGSGTVPIESTSPPVEESTDAAAVPPAGKKGKKPLPPPAKKKPAGNEGGGS